MKILIAPDSFKESLTASEVCRAVAKGIKKIFPRAKIISVPVADGGEGTLDAIVQSRGGKIKRCQTHGPLGRKITARYGLVDGGQTAIIEMAQASGLELVPPQKRNPMKTSSFGTGEMIRQALNEGCGTILLTLGGVATNDAGVGMAKALGYKFIDEKGREIPSGAGGLKQLYKIETNGADPRLKKVRFIAACDVKNPLCGKQGSAAVYGPQKGATPAMILQIDSTLKHFAKVVKRDLSKEILNLPGAGAAGGAGAGAAAILDAELKPGVEMVIEATRLEEKMRGVDLVITGEGRIDEQTVYGKTLSGVARIAKKQKVPVIAFCGQIGKGAEKVRKIGIDSIFSIAQGSISVEESIKNAAKLLERATMKIMRMV